MATNPLEEMLNLEDMQEDAGIPVPEEASMLPPEMAMGMEMPVEPMMEPGVDTEMGPEMMELEEPEELVIPPENMEENIEAMESPSPEQEMSENEYLDNEDLVKEVLKEANTSFEDFKSARQDYEEIWNTADYMYKCAQNKSKLEEERKEGANNGEDAERANTGSTMFFRQNNQLTSAAMSVIKSQTTPFKYSPIVNEGVFMSPEDCLAQTEQWNCLAEWNMEVDKFNSKMFPFFHNVFKYGNIPVIVEWLRERGKRIVKKEIVEGVVVDGVVQPRIVGYKDIVKEVVTKNYFTWRKISPDSLYADPMIPDLESQDTVILVTLRNMAEIRAMSKYGYYNEDKIKEVTDKEKWDGTTNRDLVIDRMENNDVVSPSIKTEVYLVWDIFKRIPIVDNKIDKENGDFDWRLLTVVGNSIGDGVCIRFIDNPDPDKELPIKMIHDLPDDDDDLLYHMCRAQAVRSNYAAECTLKNQTIDNGTLLNDPPLIEVEGMVRGTDRSFVSGQVFTVDSIDALKEFDIKPLANSNIQLLEYIKADSKMALSTDSLMMGEAAGSRTSATEITKLDKYSSAPILITIDYILQQFLNFYARKFISYWKKYKMEEQVIAITDQPTVRTIEPEGLYGEFDVKIDIVDEFQNDMVEQSNIAEAFTLIAQNQALAAVVDLPELMTQWFKKKKLDYTKLVKRSTDFDARIVAQQENRLMMELGQQATVKPGENNNAHLAVHEGEKLRYMGVEDRYPNLILLERHIAETKNAASGQGTQQSAPLPGSSAPSVEGNVTGDQLAGAMAGGMM